MNIKFIVSRYQDADFLIQRKAQYLFIVCLGTVAITLFLLPFAAVSGRERLILTTISIAPSLSASITAIILMLLKKYTPGVNIFVIFNAMGIGLAAFLQFEVKTFATVLIYAPVLVIFAVLFSDKLITSILSGGFIAFDIMYFLLMKNRGVDLKLLAGSFAGSVASLVITYILAIVLVNLLSRAHDITSEESDKNMRLFQKTSELLGDIQLSIKNLAVSSKEMCSTSRDFSDNAQNQAAFVEQATTTIEEVASVVENVAASVKEQDASIEKAVAKMKELSETIGKMGNSVNEAMESTVSISGKLASGEDSLKDMSTSMSKIIESSDEMTNIIKIINDISNKINLLSLNAAIEAARAGDAGRGFAVVADEISKLADQTASSIKDIDNLIKVNNHESQRGMDNVNKTVETMKMIIDGVNSINTLMKGISGLMNEQLQKNTEASSNADSIRQNAQEIKVATEELKIVIDEINKSITNINDLIQSNAAGAEKMAADAEEVQQNTEHIKDKIDTFSELS